MVLKYCCNLSLIFFGSTNIFIPICSAALNMAVRTFWFRIPKSGCINKIGNGISSIGKALTASEPSSLKAS